MPEQWIPQSRAERLIAIGRSVLAISSVGALYLEPAQVHPWAWKITVLYTIYALSFLVWTIFGPAGLTDSVGVATNAFDLAVFGAINFLTFSGTSPFFVYFVFGIICAMLRFGRRGTVVTALLALIVFVFTSAIHIETHGRELNRFVIRAAYLAVVASLLIYLAEYLQRLQADLSRIARWPRSLPPTHEHLITEILREPALIFEAKRVLVAYEHKRNRYGFLALRDGDGIEVVPVDPTMTDLLLDSGSETFVRAGSFASLRPGELSASPARTPRAIPPEVVHEFRIEDVVATSFSGDRVRGRLLLLDGRPPLLEEINLARIVAAVIASRLDQHHAAEQLRSGAVAQERVRVARDLHDSVLQSLTGIALQLRTIPRVIARDPREAELRLREMEDVIGMAQRDLRWFIDQLHPERRDRVAAGMGESAISMAQRFQQQWGLEVVVDPLIHELPNPLRNQAYTLVSEAIANAAKHARAKSVHVDASMDETGICINVTDDGKGFPFIGRYAMNELQEMQHGPAALQERVVSLGGSLIVDSSDQGSRIEIHLPKGAIA